MGEHSKQPYSGRHCRPSRTVQITAGAAASAVVITMAVPALAVSPAHALQAGAEAPVHAGTHVTAARLTADVRADLAQDVTVAPGNTLSGMAARYCGSAGRWPDLASANSSVVKDPNLIYPGEVLKVNCEGAPRTDASDLAATGRASAVRHAAAASTVTATGTVGTSGMGSFEACVIQRESGGDPRAVNPASDAGGLFQFLPSTWAGLGFALEYPGGAQTAPSSVQEDAFAEAFAQSGTSPWAPYDGC